MLFEIEEKDGEFSISTRSLSRNSAAELGLREKHIENWLANHPHLLLPNEQVLVIGQSVSGQSMADVLALDAFGRLVIVEVKRGRSGRETVAQLLGYAARMRGITYEELDAITQRHRSGLDLYTRFLEFNDGQVVPREQLGNEQRVIIVASESDADLKQIVGWLAGYGVPIQFVPFTIYAAEGKPRFIEIDGVVSSPELALTHGEWAGDWIFNTNETFNPGAYARMFERGVAAIYGYPNGGRNLEGANPENRVFAYVNRQGLCALGTVIDGVVRPGKGIFFDAEGQQQPEEYHLGLRWDVVLPEEKAISVSEAQDLGYRLPIRSTFAKLRSGEGARRLEAEIRRRAEKP
jgi:hypothetical protein